MLSFKAMHLLNYKVGTLSQHVSNYVYKGSIITLNKNKVISNIYFLLMPATFNLLEIEFDRSIHRQRVFRDRLNPLNAYSDVEFIARYRVDRIMFTESVDRLDSCMFRSTSRSFSIPATTQLAVNIKFLAIGTFQTAIASCHGISQSSVSRCISEGNRCTVLLRKRIHLFPR